MSSKGRVVTVTLEIQTHEYPRWILDAHLKGPQHDVKVTAIAEGDAIRKLHKLEEDIAGDIDTLDNDYDHI